MNGNKPQILVTGGNGVLGKVVCALLDKKDIAYLIASHKRGKLPEGQVFFDLQTGEGMAGALNGITTILHLATDVKNPDNDVSGTRFLLDEIRRQDSPIHLIYISIVGIDLVPRPYFRQKLETEQAIQQSGLPYTILRATQFHEFITQIIGSLSKLPLIAIVPKDVVVQPIEVKPVAEKLINLIGQPAQKYIIEIGGPEKRKLGELAEGLLKQEGKNRLIINWPFLGKFGNALRSGALTTFAADQTGLTWFQWLRKTY